ncbi:MAG: DUF1566 domain-containing protein, partial [Rubrivivax sp.]|nr:DUF1566 domain-containing protein [Rubrivivax sp.]
VRLDSQMENTMRKLRNGFLGICSVAAWVAMGASVHAASGNGPYYATPSWAQKMDAATRFIVLLNWRSEAVLDRETGLVWERVHQRLADSTENFTVVNTWDRARLHCVKKNVGGRRGWRLASIVELMSLTEPDLGDQPPGGAFPPGHPFDTSEATGPGVRYWTATTASSDYPNSVWTVSFRRNDVGVDRKDDATSIRLTWCVRGNTGMDQF